MASTEWEVVKGDNIWNIAAETLMTPENPQPSLQDIVVRMEELIKLNLDTLKASPGKGNPDLIYPGMRLKLTAAPAPGDAAKKGRVDDGASLPEKGEETKQGQVDDGASLPEKGGTGTARNLTEERDARLNGATPLELLGDTPNTGASVQGLVPRGGSILSGAPYDINGNLMSEPGYIPPGAYNPGGGPPTTTRNLTDERNARTTAARNAPGRNLSDERDARTTAARNAPGRNLSDERDARLSRLPTGVRGRQNMPQ